MLVHVFSLQINTLRRQIADLLNADNSPIASGSGGNANKTVCEGDHYQLIGVECANE